MMMPSELPKVRWDMLDSFSGGYQFFLRVFMVAAFHVTVFPSIFFSMTWQGENRGAVSISSRMCLRWLFILCHGKSRLQICPQYIFGNYPPHRWYQKGSKYWWNQGLAALIQRQIYNPVNHHHSPPLGRIHPGKLTCPLKINGWKKCISYWNSPFLGDEFVSFRGWQIFGTFSIRIV